MNDYIKLPKAPEWVLQYPKCSVCTSELETDGDGWTCPTCGTFWDMKAGDGDTGILYADWSGDEPGGAEVANDHEALQWSVYREQVDKHRRWPDLFPDTPRRPVSRGRDV